MSGRRSESTRTATNRSPMIAWRGPEGPVATPQPERAARRETGGGAPPSEVLRRLRPQARAGGNRREAAARARSEVGNVGRGPTERSAQAPAAASEGRREPPRSGGPSAQRGGERGEGPHR